MEVALSLLVLSVGLLAVFGLMPTALSMGQKASEETRAAIFARDVFSGVRAHYMINNWNNNSVDIGAAAPGFWDDPSGLRVRSNTGWQTLVFRNAFNEDIVEYAIRYRLLIEDTGMDIKAARLEVAPGEFGKVDASGDPEDPHVFYMEIFNTGY